MMASRWRRRFSTQVSRVEGWRGGGAGAAGCVVGVTEGRGDVGFVVAGVTGRGARVVGGAVTGGAVVG
ncbi:MAG: hypothetical protein ACRDZ7_19460, partial [Acidimicrobiia bacterium]